MCGIAGYIGTRIIEQDKVHATLELMKRRGPDQQDFAQVSLSNGQATLLHSRLSIIDLDQRSNQPFVRGNHTLVYNGEIYNYKEVRTELEGLGHAFTTDSDTEVLMMSFKQWGKDCVDKLEGMWAFVILDTNSGELFGSRDRFAEKPFYLYQTNHGLYFASEVKAIKQLSGESLTVDTDHMMRFMVNGHKSLYKHNSCFFKEITELSFGENFTYSIDDGFNSWAYFTPTSERDESMTEEEAVAGIRERLINSVRLRLRSDVPLAFCLSGGVDSSSLVSIAAKELNADVTTFSIIDSDARYNELDNIEATVADTGCKSIKVALAPNDSNIDRLKDLIDYHDAPIATISYLVHSMLSEQISAGGFKISMSGTAADEMFTGYYDHFNMHMYETRNEPNHDEIVNNWKEYPAKTVRNPFLSQPDLFIKDPSFRDHIYLNNDVFASYMKGDFKVPFREEVMTDSLLRNRMLNELFYEVVRVILHEDDLNSMRYSIENRSPFLDSELFRFAYSIPTKYLIGEGHNKYLLRKAMKGILNDEVRLCREKKGFNASINSILDFDNPNHMAMILDNSPIFDLVDKGNIETLLKQGEYPNSFKKFLFNFINCKLFLETQKSV